MLFTLSLFCLFMQADAAPNLITQVSTIDALLAGSYEGVESFRELLNFGTLGLGTFEHLDGELLILDSEVYQIKADGKVYQPELSATTPFAVICPFQADKNLAFEKPLSFKETKKLLDELMPNGNTFCALKIEGTFTKMKTRSVPAQKPPYPPLADVVKNQTVFDMKNIKGTIVGFRSPKYMSGINVVGYHFHFISEDRKQGGHILDFNMTSGQCEIDICDQFLLKLPEKGSLIDEENLTQEHLNKLIDVIEK